MKKGIDIPVIIGTRGSELALWQARFTQEEFKKNGILSELKIIKTTGDATQDWNLSFDKIEGKGFFTKELEEALLHHEIDLAVHSCKDLPTESPQGLDITAYSKRANPFDILLIKKDKADATQLLKLPLNAVVGTSSARRKSQLLAFRPDIELRDLRGNVPTRVQKLKDGLYDAILLAVAGLERLQISLDDFETIELKAPMFVPAPAQGVLAFQIRWDDEEMKSICGILHDQSSEKITSIERQILHDFEGGCQMPLGVYSVLKGEDIHTWIAQADAWNTLPKRIHFVIAPEQNFDSAAVVSRFKNNDPSSVFISSDLEENNYLQRVLEAHHYSLSYRSLLDFTSTDFYFDGNADWLFFSSKNAIRFFFDKADPSNLQKIKLAAVGESTAQDLRKMGLRVDFTGDGSGAGSARLFEQATSGKVVFPIAGNSLREVQKNITSATIQTSDLVVYQNTPSGKIEKRAEKILVFTSSMNAAAYFEKHRLEPYQQVIANGASTSKKLTELSIPHSITFTPYAWSIADSIFSL